MANEKSNTADREIFISRKLNAPVDLVWKAWSRPEHIGSWWGPDKFTTTIHKMDLRPGGEWNLVLHGPDGTDYKGKSIFREVIPCKKIVYEQITSPKFIATVEFEAQGEMTFITWRMVFETVEEFIRTVKTYGADEGQKQNVEKLITYLAGMK